MRKRLGVIIVLGVGIFVVIAIIVFPTPPSLLVKTNFGKPVQEFSLDDLNGKRVSLGDFRGKIVVINFWLVSCDSCLREFPLLMDYYQRYALDLVVLGVNSGDSKEAIAKYLEISPVSYPILLDTQGDIMRMFYVRGFPTTFFVDSDGVVRAQYIGELTTELLDGYFSQIGLIP